MHYTIEVLVAVVGKQRYTQRKADDMSTGTWSTKADSHILEYNML